MKIVPQPGASINGSSSATNKLSRQHLTVPERQGKGLLTLKQPGKRPHHVKVSTSSPLAVHVLAYGLLRIPALPPRSPDRRQDRRVAKSSVDDFVQDRTGVQQEAPSWVSIGDAGVKGGENGRTPFARGSRGTLYKV